MLSTALLLLAVSSSAKATIVVADRPVDAMRAEWVHVEPHLAVDPENADHWVVGTIVTTPDQSSWHCAALATFDGGESWIRHDFDMGRCIDPWAIVFADGSAVVTAIEIQTGFEGDRRFELLRAVSEDGGRNWSDQESLGRTFEHNIIVPAGENHWMVARRTHYEGEDPQRVLHVSRTKDRLGALDTRAEFLPAGETGSVVATGLAAMDPTTLVISYSRWEPDFRVAAVRSIDGGRTFSDPVPISERCGSGDGTFIGYPFMVGRSEDLFHACAGDDYLGYWLSVSNDGGMSWAEARRVDGGGDHTQVRTPMLAVGDEGVLAMAWYDRRHDPDLECQDLYFAGSADGGKTIGESIRVTTETSCPNAPGNGRAGAQSWNSGGDYSSLAALPDGRFAVVWADSRSGRFQLRTATIRLAE